MIGYYPLWAYKAVAKRATKPVIEKWVDMPPLQWIDEVLGVRLWSKQSEIVESTFRERRTVVQSCHGIGKTFTAAVTVLAFLYTRQPCKVITTAPTWYQVKDLLWSEINTLFRTRLESRYGKVLTTALRISDNHFALGISPKDAVNFQGFHSPNILVVFDEAPGVRSSTIEGADSLMSAGNAHQLWIGNPTESQGHFYEACNSPQWNHFKVRYQDTPNFTNENLDPAVRAQLINQRWIDEKIQDWGVDDPRYQSRVLGDFPDITEDQVISRKWVDAATERQIPIGDEKGVLSIDVARFGDDKTVYSEVFGNVLLRQTAESKKSITEIVGKAISVFKAGRFSHIRVDDVGVGGGVTDGLVSKGLPVIPINAGSSSNFSDFYNLRAEMTWGLRDWIQKASIPNHPQLKADLIAPKYSYTEKGQIKIEGKADMKKRLNRSPDFGDSLIYGAAVLPQVRYTPQYIEGI
jgi:hypothetical protein